MKDKEKNKLYGESVLMKEEFVHPTTVKLAVPGGTTYVNGTSLHAIDYKVNKAKSYALNSKHILL